MKVNMILSLIIDEKLDYLIEKIDETCNSEFTEKFFILYHLILYLDWISLFPEDDIEDKISCIDPLIFVMQNKRLDRELQEIAEKYYEMMIKIIIDVLGLLLTETDNSSLRIQITDAIDKLRL